MYVRGVTGGVLNPNSTRYPDHGHYRNLPLQGKVPTAEPEIESGTSWLAVRSSDHQATMLVRNTMFNVIIRHEHSFRDYCNDCSPSQRRQYIRIYNVDRWMVNGELGRIWNDVVVCSSAYSSVMSVRIQEDQDKPMAG
jgi:hypothetical protein